MAGNRTLIILAIVSLLLLSPTAHSLRHIKAGPASGPAQAQYKEDFNGDGNINITDAIALLLYQRSNPGDSRGDYNGDGKANMNDAIALLLAIRGGNLTPVEEPPEEEPEELDVEEVIQDLIMVPVPAGSFTIGEYDRSDDKVRLIKGIYLTGFQMSATEITQEQYQAVMGDNPAYQTGDYSSPVEQVSWVDAEAFCNRLSEAAGFEPCYEYDLGWGGYWKCDFTKDGFRLPTNCEWEYACRAETQANTGVTKYYNGDSENDLDRAGWYKGNSGLITHPVAQKEPNAWGLFDMLGNVGEWCEDWYPGADYNTYDVSKLDPVYGILGDHGPMGERPQRVVRGGTFVSDAQHSTSFERSGYSPERKYNVTGFRVVRRGERSIQGKVMKDGSGLAGISIRISGGGRESSATYTPEGRYLEITSDRFDTTLTTAEDGSYLLEGMTYGTYTLTPTAGGYDFDPVSIRFFLDAVKRSIEPIIAKAGDLGVVSDIVCFSDGGSVILNDQVALEIPAHEFWNGRKYEDSGKVVVRLEALEPGSLPLLSEMPVVGTPVELAFFYPDGNPIPADSLPSLRYPVRLEDMKVSFKLDNFSGDPENLAAVSIGADSVLRYLDTGYDEAEGWLSAELPLPKLCGPQLSAAGANPSPEWIWIVRQVVSSLIKITVVKMDNYFCKDDKWAKLEPPDAPDEKRIPVIFIHGYQKWNQTCTFYHATEPFPELREYLEKQSYIKKYFQLFTFTYPTFYEPKHNGMSLAARIADRFPTEGNDLVLVCHDMGGLVGRHYIEMEGGHNQVQLIITCGTPHLGTSLAILPSTFWPTDGAKSLVPGSDAIDELAKSADEISLLTTKYITYAGSNDWVVSVSSATNEDGSLWSHADRVTSRVFKGYDHDQMHTGNKNFAPEDDSLFIAIHNDLKNVIKKPLLLEYELSPETRWVVEGTVFKARYRIDNPNQIPIKLHLKLWFKTGKGKDDKLLVPADNSEDYYEVEMDPGEEWFEKPCMVPEGVEDNSRYPVSWDIYDFDDSLLVSSGWNSDTVISYGSGTYPQDLTSCASIPAGSFMMGNDWDEWIRGYSNYANPPHSVELDGFRMSYTEITQGHWELVMGSFSFSNTITEGDLNLPVAGINWKDAAYFCNKLSVLGGVDPCYDLETWNCDFDKNGFRLPTEAEWEYACRAGTKTSCYVGNPPKSYAPGTTTPEFVRFEQALKRVAWFFPGWVVKDGERVYADPAYVADRHPVRGKYANNFGLYDMLGNVSELCHNVYSEDFYDITPNKNPRGPGFVSRGGCYGSEAVPSLLSAYRYEAESYSYGNPYTGFRIVRRQAISEEEPE